MTDLIVRILIGGTPVIVFLIALIFLDSYKLVRLRAVLMTLCSGVIAALLCLFINTVLMKNMQVGGAAYAQYVSPWIEETAKALFLFYLIRSKKVGFMVDGAIHGFAVGAGFAVMENLYTLTVLTGGNLFIWILRGFGTAIMHGGTSAIFGFLSKSLSDRYESKIVQPFLPGLGVAIVFHSLYNHFLLSPLVSAVVLVVGLPLLMVIIYQRSEQRLQKWLGVGFDTDAELLQIITTGNITETRIGEFLMSLKQHLQGAILADMLCLLRLHLELSIHAKGILLMREAGFSVPIDPEIDKKFQELRYLEKSVGRIGRQAIHPFLRWSSRDLWQFHMLGKK